MIISSVTPAEFVSQTVPVKLLGFNNIFSVLILLLSLACCSVLSETNDSVAVEWMGSDPAE